MRLLRNLFKKNSTVTEPSSDTSDMRTTPVNNPLDFREDGTIREGDPAWGFLQELMNTNSVGIATQRDDGTWETQTIPIDNEKAGDN